MCLPAGLQAFPSNADSTYTVTLPVAAPPAQIEFQVAYTGLPGAWTNSVNSLALGGWEVTVAFDPAHCELHCTYRRTREGPFLQPITTIRINSSPPSNSTTIRVDPAGLGLPTAASPVSVAAEAVVLSGKGFAAPELLAGRGGPNRPIGDTADLLETDPWAAHTLVLPLRI